MDARHTIDELLTILSDMITEAWSMPLSGGKVMLDRERVMELINEIKNVLPTDIQEARAIVASRNELANAARRDADAIIKAAEDRARSLVNESAIYTEAKRAANEIATAAAAKAKDILNNADQKARETTAAADAHAVEVVKTAENRAKELRAATSQFVNDALARSEESVANAPNELHRVRQQFKQIPPTAK